MGKARLEFKAKQSGGVFKMSESEHQRKVFINENSKKNTRVFRNNVGFGWCGKVLKKFGACVTLVNASPVKFGLCPGSADLIGLEKIEITLEMVGKKIGRFVAIECKSKTGVQKTEQEDFQSIVEKLGGKYILSRKGE